MIKESKQIGTKVSMPYGWREFKVGDLFDVSGTHGFDKGDIVLSSHGTEFIGRTETNNGVQGFYDDPFVAPNEANTISISQIGAQTAQYRRNQWYASQNLFKLIPKFDMHERHALFLIGFINKGLSIYSGYSHFPKVVDIADMQLLLPVTQAGQPDYGWMSSYIRELEDQRIRELDTYLQVTGLDNTTLTDNEVQVLEQWRQHEKFGGGTLLTKRFAPLELFDFPMARSLNKDDLIVKSNGSPYVTRTVENNGVNMLIDLSIVPDEYVNAGNEFSFGLLGLEAFYQKRAYVAGQFVRRFVPKFDMNETLSMYFKTLIDKLKPELQTTSIKGYVDVLAKPLWELPVTNDGTPNYEFMQTFIRAQEKLVMQRLDKFRQLQIDTTRQII